VSCVVQAREFNPIYLSRVCMSWTTVEELCELSELMQCASNLLHALHTDYTQISSTSMAPFLGKISWSNRPCISIVPKRKKSTRLMLLRVSSSCTRYLYCRRFHCNSWLQKI
jgi:hypothetical protein